MLRWYRADLRLVVMLVALGACGRISFDAVGDAQGTADAPLALPLTCGQVSTAAGAPIAPDTDLVVNTVGTGFGVAWVDRSQMSIPSAARFDAQQQLVGGIQQVAAGAGDFVGGLLERGGNVYLDTASGVNHSLVELDMNLQNGSVFDAAVGLPVRDCLLGDALANNTAAVIAEGTLLYAGYFGSTSIGTQDTYDTGTQIDSIGCQPGSDHIHIAWSTTGNQCTGVVVDMTPPISPSFSTTFTFSTDCRTPRAALVDVPLDTGAVVWSTVAGGVETAHIGATADTISLTSSGKDARVGFDGQRIWLAWTDSGTGVLHVGHRTPTGPITEAALVGVSFAGPESYEIARLGAAAYLVVASDVTDDITFLALCP